MEEHRKQIILHVDGISCTGCEARIENAIEKLEGIKRVKAIFSSSNVYVSFDEDKIDLNKIIEVIEKTRL